MFEFLGPGSCHGDSGGLWQYRLWSFHGRDTKLKSFFFVKNQHIQRKLLNLANWCGGEVSKFNFQNQF